MSYLWPEAKSKLVNTFQDHSQAKDPVVFHFSMSVFTHRCGEATNLSNTDSS